MICEIEGRVLGGMQFGVLVDAAFQAWRPGVRGHAVWGCWWMLLCELDGRVLRGMQFGVLVDAALRA